MAAGLSAIPVIFDWNAIQDANERDRIHQIAMILTRA